MTTTVCAKNSFRQAFNFVNRDTVKWFPGHMATSMKKMQQKLKTVDCIIEVHDSRIPVSGRNPSFYHLLTAIRPHILVLNKMDLADLSQRNQLVSSLKQDRGVNSVIFTNSKDHQSKGLREILPTAINLIKSSERYTRTEEDSFLLMIIGVPNVGKSSLINQLRGLHMKRGKATQVGATPGVTRSVLERIKMHENPRMYLLDTPGIMAPNIKNTEVGMKLALCGVLKDHLVGPSVIADYILYWLNKSGNASYVDYLNLKEPCDNIQEVLFKVAVNLNKTIKFKTGEGSVVVRPNFEAAAYHIIRAFREAKFGPVNLDYDLVTDNSKNLTN